MASECMHMMLSNFTYFGTPDYDRTELNLPNPPIIVIVGNHAAVHIENDDQVTKRNQHISKRFHYMKEGQKMFLHLMKYQPKEDLLADITTKTKEVTKELPQWEWVMSWLPDLVKA
eukprot:7830091-Ditylum_brightwellii.AAC.1